MSPPEPPRRPSTEYGVRTRTQPVPGGPLTGPTPKPPSSGDHLVDAYPPGVNAATAAFLEGLFMEQLAAQDQRFGLRVQTMSKAQESAELTMARRQTKHEAHRGNVWRTVAIIATLAATSIGTVLGTAWGVYRNYRAEAGEQAAQDAVKAVAPVIPPAIAPLTTRLDDADQRIDQIDNRLGKLELGVNRVLELLEPATEVHVPQGRKRPR
jgi:hypothetical protein